MRVTILAVGGVRGALATVVRDYEKRACRYWKLDAIEVEAGAPGGSDDRDAVRSAEQKRLLARVPGDVELVALTRTGRPIGSRAFASYLEQHALHARDVAFVIGGAHGVGDELLARARPLTLSVMTLPHEVARLVLVEQLYRAGTILRGEPYHKGP